MDFRLKIDHSLFINGADEDRKSLLRDMLKRSLEILESKVDVQFKKNILILRESIFQINGHSNEV
jgi:hypothetical protein